MDPHTDNCVFNVAMTVCSSLATDCLLLTCHALLCCFCLAQSEAEEIAAWEAEKANAIAYYKLNPKEAMCGPDEEEELEYQIQEGAEPAAEAEADAEAPEPTEA